MKNDVSISDFCPNFVCPIWRGKLDLIKIINIESHTWQDFQQPDRKHLYRYMKRDWRISLAYIIHGRKFLLDKKNEIFFTICALSLRSWLKIILNCQFSLKKICQYMFFSRRSYSGRIKSYLGQLYDIFGKQIGEYPHIAPQSDSYIIVTSVHSTRIS